MKQAQYTVRAERLTQARFIFFCTAHQLHTGTAGCTFTLSGATEGKLKLFPATNGGKKKDGSVVRGWTT